MNANCPETGPRLDALLDGELAPAEADALRAHLESCAACAAEISWRRELKGALGRLALPAPPHPLEARDFRPRFRRLFPAAAAALFVAALVLLSVPAPLPELVALTSRLHEEILSGRLTPSSLGLNVTARTTAPGECACAPDLGAGSPLILYRQGETAISLLIAEGAPAPLPASARRRIGARDAYVFRAGRDTALVCAAGTLSHVWVSRLGEDELVRALLSTREGRRLFSDESVSLEAMACQACCSLLESREAGIKSAGIGIMKIELVETTAGGKVDLRKVLETLGK